MNGCPSSFLLIVLIVCLEAVAASSKNDEGMTILLLFMIAIFGCNNIVPLLKQFYFLFHWTKITRNAERSVTLLSSRSNLTKRL